MLNRGDLMRTTIRLDDSLLDETGRADAEHDMTLTAIIEESLRERSTRSRAATHTQHTRLPTIGGDGTLPGVDLDNSASLLDVMDDRR